jgi:hypothetical protein
LVATAENPVEVMADEGCMIVGSRGRKNPVKLDMPEPSVSCYKKIESI